MISWWHIEFLDALEGRLGYLKFNTDNGMNEGIFFDDGTLVTGEFTYSTLLVDVEAPDWA